MKKIFWGGWEFAPFPPGPWAPGYVYFLLWVGTCTNAEKAIL